MKFEVKDLVKSFGEKQVLKGVSFSVESGAALGLLGRNGAGKTTTIRIIMGLFAPDSGNVLLYGKPFDIRKSNVGYMPEERGLYPKKRVFEQLIYFAELRGLDKKTAAKNADSLLARLEMTEHKNAKLMTLSKGNQQKIQLIATLVCDPDIVILDEPFSGLDPVNAKLLKDVVRELIENGKIVIFSSHQMNYIEEFCDDIVILNSGSVAVEGSIKEIKHRLTHGKVVIESDDFADLLGLLEESECVKEVETDESGLIVTLAEDADMSSLLKIITSSKASVKSVSEYEPSLSEIFVEYTEVES